MPVRLQNGCLPCAFDVADLEACLIAETRSSEPGRPRARPRWPWPWVGVTVLLIHHTNASGTRERGHSAMRGAADFMIEMRPEDDVVKLECSKMRNGPPFETMT